MDSPDAHTARLLESQDDNVGDTGQAAGNASRARRVRENHADEPQFTLRALLLGLAIGILIAFSNTYFGLQTGWISGMAMPSALIGFAYFKGLRALAWKLGEPFKQWGIGDGFSEVENVLVQTVAGSVGTMPLGCGFVGVIPALEFLLKPSEAPHSTSTDPEITTALAIAQKSGGLSLPLGKLMLWALGLCFFGVLFAVPLRKEVIIREKLKFPSGTATALMIGVLHGGVKTGVEGNIEELAESSSDRSDGNEDDESRALMSYEPASHAVSSDWNDDEHDPHASRDRTKSVTDDWRTQIKLLSISFAVSGLYTLGSYFVPQVHAVPLFGTYFAQEWLWSLNPSPAYIGQGIIMGPATTIHMLLGAIIGWAILSPLAKYQGWAPGPVEDWNSGSKGWIVWISLAIMLADAIVSLSWLVLRPTIWFLRYRGRDAIQEIQRGGMSRYFSNLFAAKRHDDDGRSPGQPGTKDEKPYDAPSEHQIGVKTTVIGLVLTLGFCIFAIQYSFAGIIDIGLTILALVLAMLLSIMGVRALGETDLNPVSGISKLTQLIFALLIPPGNPNAVTINLIAGGISEAGALQAGDLLQDLKTGHLLGASPKAQFWGQLIGSAVGAVVSAMIYKLYTATYKIPGGIFQVPTAFVWIFTARLVTGQGLPPHTAQFAAAAAAIWAVLTALRIYGGAQKAWWTSYVPGGIAVAVGMYNTPSFTLARTFGGLAVWYWTFRKKRAETPMIVLSSGLILGEGLLSIVNLALASGEVPHL